MKTHKMARKDGSRDQQPRKRRKNTEQEKADARRRRDDNRRNNAQLRGSMDTFLAVGSIRAQVNDSQQTANDQHENQLQAEQPNPETSEAAPEQPPEPEERREVHMAPVGAPRTIFGIDGESELDDDDDDYNEYESDEQNGEEDEDEECELIANADGPMQQYLKAIHKRLQEEVLVKQTRVMDRWLLKILERHEWSVPTTLQSKVCSKLGLGFSLQAYHCKIIVWLPDVMYGESPPCPNKCGINHADFTVGATITPGV